MLWAHTFQSINVKHTCTWTCDLCHCVYLHAHTCSYTYTHINVCVCAWAPECLCSCHTHTSIRRGQAGVTFSSAGFITSSVFLFLFVSKPFYLDSITLTTSEAYGCRTNRDTASKLDVARRVSPHYSSAPSVDSKMILSDKEQYVN